MPIALLKDSNTYRIFADQINTPRVITDNTHNTLWAWESKPFGESAPDDDVDKDGTSLSYNLRFPGQYYDAETGKHYNFNRDYDPVTGRYVQSDPIGLDGGLNGYGYVSGNPVNLFDVQGLVEGCVKIPFLPVAICVEPKDDNHRGRIQIQNNSGYEASRSWTQGTPPTKIKGTAWLGTLWAELAIRDKKMRKRLEVCGAFIRAERFILSGPYQASDMNGSKSFDCTPMQIDGERIDIDLFKGTAFINPL